MPSGSIHNSTRAQHAHNRKRAHQLKAAANNITAAPAGNGATLAAGARVLDLVTGTEGTITTATADHIVNAAGMATRTHAFTVKLADGAQVSRTQKQLAALPAGLVSALIFSSPGESGNV